MIEVKEECTGCMACRNICPTQAIGQTVNVYGFVVPVIHQEKCVDCGLCEKVCPLGKNGKKQLPMKAYAMYHQSEAVVKMSSSGGVFYALAAGILEQGGIVFGCYYDVEQKRAYLTDTDHISLEKLLTSKYVESYVEDGLRQVKEQLDARRKVLFCGTPCQAAGLTAFLQQDYENLLVVDFTCGAVSAQSYLRDYLFGLERRFQSKITGMSFRDKHYGWGQYCFLAEFENGKIYRRTAMSDPYFFCFLRSSMQRVSCHGCRFSDNHFSDVILSDFWKCDSFEVDGNGRRGISLVLAMTEKGKKALEEAGTQMHVEELDREKASYNLKSRNCPEDKFTEIYAHQECASRQGVAVLRKRLLSPRKRLYFAVRQFVMDHPKLAVHFLGLVGNGQIMK